jgi:hypothetical protein
VAVSAGVVTAQPPSAEERAAALKRIKSAMAPVEEHLFPLYILGDLNEDGAMANDDLVLAEEIVRSGVTPLKNLKTVGCPAAADLDQDTEITDADLAMFRDIISNGPAVSPPLFHQPGVPCLYRTSKFATQLDAQPGEIVALRLLDESLTTNSVSVRVERGQATIAPDPLGEYFLIEILPTATDGDEVILELTLPGGQSYFYLLSIFELP